MQKTLCGILLVTAFCYNKISAQQTGLKITQVERPSKIISNTVYPGNRSPLEPLCLIKLPIGHITPDGWGLCGLLPQSPVTVNTSEEIIKLIPMGAARLRISPFPVIED